MWVPFHKRPSFAHVPANKKNRELAIPGFLSKPKTEKLDGENIITKDGLEIGHSSMQGFRVSMEDQHIIEDFDNLDGHHLVAVLDGHAGKGTAIYASLHLKDVLERTESWKSYCAVKNKGSDKAIELISKSLVEAYIEMDNLIKDDDFYVSS